MIESIRPSTLASPRGPAAPPRPIAHAGHQPTGLIALQRTIGNRAVCALLEAMAQAAAADAKAKSSRAPAPPTVLRNPEGVAAADDVVATGRRGVSGGGAPLPHRDAIQRCFGVHDIGAIQAHTGDAAREASRALGAAAYAMGEHVAFARPPSLHTAAHEAAHVVQQRAGVQLRAGIGETADRHERHADAVADKVVAGHSAEALLGAVAPPRATADQIQRREVATDAEIAGVQDWTVADRVGNTPRWQAACLHNLTAMDASQYVKVVERRDFYKWFYEYSVRRGFSTRWALAAHLVADGAHQIADMDDEHGLANDALGLASVELQGAMREGNQVIFDNVLPKLKDLVTRPPPNALPTKDAALAWDMKILAEEQTLVQAMYAKLSPESIEQLDYIARKKRLAGLGAWWTGEDQVPAGPFNNAGVVPAFDQPDITSIADRWRYGMGLGDQFTPGGSGYDAHRDKMPAVGAGYRSGTEFARVDTRHNLHALDAWLNPDRMSRIGAGSNLQAIIGQLSEFEKHQILADRSPDGWAYSIQFAQFLGVREAMVWQALPAAAGLDLQRNAFVTRFRLERQRVEQSLVDWPIMY